MKRIFSILFVTYIILCLTVPLIVLAFDIKETDNTGGVLPTSPEITQVDVPVKSGENVNITVMIPQTTQEPEQLPPDPLPKPIMYPSLYPTEVYEFYETDSRQIIKTYELVAGENPTAISRESFEREGWFFELADITKRETESVSTREQIEIVTIGTDSREMDVILSQLAPTIEYQSDDGYIGILALDISSIQVETAGTKKSNYTMTATREYPHLSSNDTSLIPKTITDNGITYTLSDINWKTQSTEAIDYNEIPASYTAIANYSAVGSRTTVTGYTTTAQYTGAISRTLDGKTVYTAYFIGKEIEAINPEVSLENQEEIIDLSSSACEITVNLETKLDAEQMPESIPEAEYALKSTASPIDLPINPADSPVTDGIVINLNPLLALLCVIMVTALITTGVCRYLHKNKKGEETAK